MSLTKVSYAMIDGASVNVLDYGAIGDGVADDTAAIQTALDTAATIGAKKVYFPYGNYLITSTLYMTSPVIMQGVGQNFNSPAGSGIAEGSVIRWGSASNEDMLVIKSSIPNQRLAGADVMGMVFFGNRIAKACIRASSIFNCNFDVECFYATEAGLVIDDGNNALSFFNNIWRFIYIYGSLGASDPGKSSHGLVLDGTISDIGVTQNNIFRISGLIYDGNMIHLTDCDGNNFFSVQAARQAGGSGYTLKLNNGNVRHARNNNIEVLWTGQVYVDSLTYGNVIQRLHSEGGGVTIVPGGQIHYNATDYGNGGQWDTQTFTMSDQFLINANDIRTDIQLSEFISYDPLNLLSGEQAETTISVPGALLGDNVFPSFSLDLQGVSLTAYVSATDTVKVVFFNGTSGAVNLGLGTLRVLVSAIPTRVAMRGEAGALWAAVNFVDDATNSAKANIVAPYRWSNGRITGLIITSCQSTTNTSANVRLRIRAITRTDNFSVSTPELDEYFTVPVNDNSLRVTNSTLTFSSPLSFTRGDFLGLRIERYGADAIDTAVGLYQILAIRVLYESTGPTTAGSGTYDIPPVIK